MRITQGTFSFLQDLTDEEIEPQLPTRWRTAGRSWSSTPTIPHPRNSYWDMWNQPEFDLGSRRGRRRHA